ncbi:MAG: hypothetical protein AVDCRST_MAG95-3770, partial [uncultured Adhaeribacter sp.]
WKTISIMLQIPKKNILPPRTHPPKTPNTTKKKVAEIILTNPREDKVANLPTVTKTLPTTREKKKVTPAAKTA